MGPQWSLIGLSSCTSLAAAAGDGLSGAVPSCPPPHAPPLLGTAGGAAVRAGSGPGRRAGMRPWIRAALPLLPAPPVLWHIPARHGPQQIHARPQPLQGQAARLRLPGWQVPRVPAARADHPRGQGEVRPGRDGAGGCPCVSARGHPWKLCVCLSASISRIPRPWGLWRAPSWRRISGWLSTSPWKGSFPPSLWGWTTSTGWRISSATGMLRSKPWDEALT